MKSDDRQAIDWGSRYATVLLGGHLGDSLGGPVETWTPQDIRQHYGRVEDLLAATLFRHADGTIMPATRAQGNWHAQQRAGEPSDDTILSLCVAKSLVERGFDLADLARRHVETIASCTAPDGTVVGGFGKTTLRAVERLAQGYAPTRSGVPGIGNAPAMKMAPVGAYAHATRRYDAGLAYAAAVGRMTHLDGRSIASGVAQAHAAHELLRGIGRGPFLEGLTDIAREAEDREGPIVGESIAARLRWVARHQGSSVDDALAILGNDGRAFSSYPFTVFMLARYWDDPLEGLLSTVNCGGDADTNAAMYGALAAARHGRFWPVAWEERLERQADCIALGERMARPEVKE